jgi:predicted histidine transporter YuiF (NhaC family)
MLLPLQLVPIKRQTTIIIIFNLIINSELIMKIILTQKKKLEINKKLFLLIKKSNLINQLFKICKNKNKKKSMKITHFKMTTIIIIIIHFILLNKTMIIIILIQIIPLIPPILIIIEKSEAGKQELLIKFYPKLNENNILFILL